MNYDYAAIPPAIIEALGNHADHHRETGDFTTAVLANDLMGAISRADADNLNALPAICLYIRNELTTNCYGSYATVRAWRSRVAA